MKHVILRTPISSGLESARPGARGGRPAVVDVAVDDIDSRRVQSLARSRGVLAVAPVMPVKLVAPIPMSADAQPAAGVAWGVGAVGAESSPFTGEGIVVSVLDTGIDASHPAFAGVELVQQDFTGEGNGDQHGHGTHCAGTIFGREVEGTRIGVATGVSKALIGKVLGAEGGSSDQILKAIQWAIDGGATVISMSLGMDFPGLVAQLLEEDFPADLATSIALEGYRSNVMLFERLASLVRAQATFAQPALLVAAAGNESRRSENPDFVINVAPPAVAEGMLSVAAVGDGPDGLTVAPFSNVGAMVSGPGVGIPSARRGGGLTSMSGTSMATPHVAGVAALWAQKLKAANQLSAANLSARLIGSATTDGMKAGFDPVDVGAGIVRAPQA
jgi:subtilisin family serine protease